MAAIASAAAAELHKANPKLYPKAPHAWGRLMPDQLHTPLLCVVCHERIQPEEDIKVTPQAESSRELGGSAFERKPSFAQEAKQHVRCLLDVSYPSQNEVGL